MLQNINIISYFIKPTKKVALQILATSLWACTTFFISAAVAGTSTQIKIQDRMYNLYVLDETEFPDAIKVMEHAKEFSSKFQKNEISEPIDNCNFVIDLPVGTVNGNHSYGGYCSTKTEKGIKSKSMIICGDVMVGHFKVEDRVIEGFRAPQDINTLAEFVAKNCTGG